jgi:hypothetical protein
MTQEQKELYYKLMTDCGALIEDCPNEKAGKRVLACEYCMCDFLVKKTAKEIFEKLLGYMGSNQKFCIVDDEHKTLIDCDKLFEFVGRLGEEYGVKLED